MSNTIYHRLATGGKNQDFHTALDQVSTREIWGARSMFGSAFPTVRAFRGPLPAGKDGIEFSTPVPPTGGASTPAEVYWKLHDQSPQVQSSDDGDFARISATIRVVRYTKETNLKPRCEWSPS
jgi:hypothetical protein